MYAGCKQELSRSAFYRNKNPSGCPGRCSSFQTPSSTSIALQLTSQIQEVNPPAVSDAVPDVSDVYEDESIAIVERDDMSSEEDNTDAETDKMPGSADLNSESSDSNDETGEVPYLDANEPLNTEVMSMKHTMKLKSQLIPILF